jgi:hypothetical protein
MTFREILSGLQGNRRMIGTIRSTLDAFMPGALDKTVMAKIIRGTGNVAFIVDGQVVGIVTCEVVDDVQALGGGKLGEDSGGPAARLADLGR